MTSSRLSVLMVLDSMDAGGTETHVLSLTKALIRSGQQVTLIAADGLLHQQFEEAGCPVFLFDYTRLEASADATRMVRIQHVIRVREVNCVHVHQTPSGLLAASAASQLGIAVVFTAHGTYYPQSCIKTLMQHSKAVISVSAPVQAYMQRLGFPSTVVPNGIDLSEFYPSNSIKLRSELGIAEDAVVLMYASRLAWGKATACDTLLRAMKDLHRYGWDKLELIVVGDGSKYEAIKALAAFIEEECGRKFIHVIGKQAQMNACYNAADIVVGTGRVALEAMACGKPVLAIGNHGYFGWVEPSSYEQAWKQYFGDHGSNAAYSRYLFASEIGEGCRSPARMQSLGAEGKRWVEHTFHIDSIIHQVMDVYRSANGETS
ncbi:glycosyltransferase family 4 protein [Paenibacillus sinopodophylli]|uniref:glycosyltransferase family 4 protein n=1 Tax=Paenibacillus sinopodophylli TaxID=1837342 RepID=UPI00110CEB43|nr:glycosyltransferase family 4 protein [Paenibacillus sinopodophylli]